VSSEGIPDNVITFIRDHIESVEQLEILLLLHAQRERDWSAEEVAKALRSSSISAEKRLSQFATLKLLTEKKDSPNRYRFAPATESLGAVVGALAEAYLIRRVTVIDLIFSKPSATLKIFADAFKIREDK
jgi:hypothetical protein